LRGGDPLRLDERAHALLHAGTAAISHTSGQRALRASSKARTILAPVAAPIEPPRKRKSIPTRTSGSLPSRAWPAATASSSPDASPARFSWSR
jgi:hypothetical protein